MDTSSLDLFRILVKGVCPNTRREFCVAFSTDLTCPSCPISEGYFMYTDSDHSPAYLVSPELTLPSGHSAYCMSFWYYMYGRPAAALLNVFLGRVVTYNKPEWSRLNAQPDKWLRGEVTIQGDQPLQVGAATLIDCLFIGYMRISRSPFTL